MSVENCRKRIKAKPFSIDFDEQLEACEKFGDVELHFPFEKEVMRKEATKALEGIRVDKKIKNRIIETLSYQAYKYQYMF